MRAALFSSKSPLSTPETAAVTLQGPSISIDTACSSSLVTAHFVSGCLRHSGCARGLSLGVNLPMNWETSFMFVGAGMTAADGRCKTLDARADGYVRSEACMAILFRHASAVAPRAYGAVHDPGLQSATPTLLWSDTLFCMQPGSQWVVQQ